jgi:hypothetical protein
VKKRRPPRPRNPWRDFLKWAFYDDGSYRTRKRTWNSERQDYDEQPSRSEQNLDRSLALAGVVELERISVELGAIREMLGSIVDRLDVSLEQGRSK